MPKDIQEPVLNYWYRALHAEFGVEIFCSDINSCQAKLYQARRDAKDLDLERVYLTTSAFDPDRIWLVKKRPTDEAA